jgi:hypothetical protein
MENKRKALIAKSKENANLLTELKAHIDIFYILEGDDITMEAISCLPDFIIDELYEANI